MRGITGVSSQLARKRKKSMQEEDIGLEWLHKDLELIKLNFESGHLELEDRIARIERKIDYLQQSLFEYTTRPGIMFKIKERIWTLGRTLGQLRPFRKK